MFGKNTRRGAEENPIFTFFLVLNGLICFGLVLWGSHNDGISLVESFLASSFAVIFVFGVGFFFLKRSSCFFFDVSFCD